MTDWSVINTKHYSVKIRSSDATKAISFIVKTKYETYELFQHLGDDHCSAVWKKTY